MGRIEYRPVASVQRGIHAAPAGLTAGLQQRSDKVIEKDFDNRTFGLEGNLPADITRRLDDLNKRLDRIQSHLESELGGYGTKGNIPNLLDDITKQNSEQAMSIRDLEGSRKRMMGLLESHQKRCDEHTKAIQQGRGVFAAIVSVLVVLDLIVRFVK